MRVTFDLEWFFPKLVYASINLIMKYDILEFRFISITNSNISLKINESKSVIYFSDWEEFAISNVIEL